MGSSAQGVGAMRRANKIATVCFLTAGLVYWQPVLANHFGAAENDVIRVFGIHNGSLNPSEMMLQLEIIVQTWNAGLIPDEVAARA